MPANAKRQIVRITQSPLNPLIWMIDLTCGHELRKVQKRKPALYGKDGLTRALLCPRCDGRLA
jgi:hypothetical protein